MKLFAKQISELKMANRAYQKFVENFLELLLRQDLGGGDRTTALLANPKKIIQAEIRTKEKGILAGIEEVEFLLKKKGVRILKKKKDGATLRKNEIILVLQASAQKIITHERVVLNLLQRMSGIATTASILAKKIGKNKFAATRKTPCGLLDTKAVVVGGGLPHRLNLADMILVKENHLAVDDECWKKIRAKDFFEIEANKEQFALEVAEFFHGRRGLILLLDNFTPAELKLLVPKIRKINPQVILEGSGGVTSKTAKAFLKSGVNFVSIGELTHSAKAMDFGLKII